MSRLSWRRQPNETGLAAICQSERDYELRFNGEILGHVSRSHKGDYYFYGCGKNSLQNNETFLEIGKAKKACKEWVKNSDHFKQLNKPQPIGNE